MSTIPTLAQDLFADSLKDVEDGSTVSDQDALKALLAEIQTANVSAVRTSGNLAKLHKRGAHARLEAMELCPAKDGLPRFSARPEMVTDAYRATVERAEAAYWATVDAADRTREQGAFRTAMRRQLEGFITQHVFRITKDDPAVAGKGDVNVESTGKTEWDLPIVIGFDKKDPAEMELRKRIAAVYLRSGLDLPEKFGGPEKGSSSGGRQPKDAANPLAAMSDAIDGMKNLTPDASGAILTNVHRVLSALAEKSITAKSIEDRSAVTSLWQEISSLSLLAAKVVEGKANENDVKTMRTHLWTATEAEKPSA